MTKTVDESLLEQDNYCNVAEWRNKGITGKNIHVWNCEDNSPKHGAITTRRIHDGAPDAIVYNAGIESSRSGDKINYVFVDYDGAKWDPEEFIKVHNIKVVSRSMKSAFAGADTGEWRALWEGLQKKYGLIIFDSAGNEGFDERNHYEGYDIALTIGAVDLVRGKIKVANYSSVTDDVDFADFTGVWSGTSFSCPYIAGKAASILERYGDMSQTEMFKYLKMIAQDVHDPGEDNRTGWGIPILPSFNKRYITMTTKSVTYFVDGVAHKMDVKPINKEGNVFIPVRFVAEALGAEVNWSKNKDKSINVYIDKDNTHIELKTGSDVAYVNGKKDILNFAPFIENGRTFVPIRFIAEALNCKVDWIQNEAKVMILEC